ncbi:MAG: ornithine cyclodeaminase [Paracoccaceae bacterium]
MQQNLNIVPFVSVDNMMRLVLHLGVERVLTDLAAEIEADFRRWPLFDKTPRVASHSDVGVIELMPTSDGEMYGFKYVNGHPKNMKEGLQTVTAFGLLADVNTGYPLLLSEMTILTALRTAAMSALAAKWLAPKGATGHGPDRQRRAVRVPGAGLGPSAASARYGTTHRPVATRKCMANLKGTGLKLVACATAEEAILRAQIITTVTADKQYSTILTDNMVGAGVHINAVGGDCPGKTELHHDILLRSDIYVEYPPQTRIEGEIQQLAPDHPVKELWQVMTGAVAGRADDRAITLFDSVGFAVEDFSALRYVLRQLKALPKSLAFSTDLDMIADPDEPRDLYGMLLRKKAAQAA